MCMSCHLCLTFYKWPWFPMSNGIKLLMAFIYKGLPSVRNEKESSICSVFLAELSIFFTADSAYQVLSCVCKFGTLWQCCFSKELSILLQRVRVLLWLWPLLPIKCLYLSVLLWYQLTSVSRIVGSHLLEKIYIPEFPFAIALSTNEYKRPHFYPGLLIYSWHITSCKFNV